MGENEENIWNGRFKENFRVFSKDEMCFCLKFVYCTCAGYVRLPVALKMKMNVTQITQKFLILLDRVLRKIIFRRDWFKYF